DRFSSALDYLGICRRIALGDHLLNDLYALLDLLGCHLPPAAGILQLHLPRHQQRAYRHVGSGLMFPHLCNGFGTADSRLPANRQRLVTTGGPCSTTSGTRTFSIRSGTPKWHLIASRIFGANWRRQARDRLPLDQLRALRLGLHRRLEVCCLQIRSTPRLTARRPHPEISRPLVMARPTSP